MTTSFYIPDPLREEFLESAKRLVWWMSARRIIERPEVLIPILLNIHPQDNLALLRRAFTDDEILDFLRQVGPGRLSEQSLSFWFSILGPVVLQETGSAEIRDDVISERIRKYKSKYFQNCFQNSDVDA